MRIVQNGMGRALQCVPLGENSWIEDDLSCKKFSFSLEKTIKTTSVILHYLIFIASIVPFFQLESPVLAIFCADAKLGLAPLCSFG